VALEIPNASDDEAVSQGPAIKKKTNPPQLTVKASVAKNAPVKKAAVASAGK
jgi:hypothetical protein